MQKLESEIGKNGFKYKKVYEDDAFYVYSQGIPEMGGKIIAYEVFEKKVAKERQTDWANMPERELFPSNEAFGVWAWSIALGKNRTEEQGLAVAMAKGEEITERVKMRS